MKKYLIRIILFFFIVAIVDYGYGKMCDYLRDHTKGGVSGNIRYICEQCDEDIIMMGSSRMRHHYEPQVFEDSLGMTCYNTGIDGNGILLSYGFLEMILQRYSPKLIIYDVTSYDMYIDDNSKYLEEMRPYYTKTGISEIFSDVDPMEKWKMKSGLYKYNSKLLGLVSDNIHPIYAFEKGYWPIQGVMDYEPSLPDTTKKQEVDSLKMKYIQKFIDLAKKHNVQVVFAASPTYHGKLKHKEHKPIRTICEEQKLPFVDHYYDSLICSNKEYWKDGSHLNDKGARVFSQEMVQELHNVIDR